MPSLKLAWVAQTKSRSFSPRSSWKLRAVGIVDSPTPTVPIASDSTSVISISAPRCLTSAAATAQPAVPPPAITARLTTCSCNVPSLSSPIQPIEQKRPQPPRLHLVHWREVALCVRRQVLGGPPGWAEHVVVEHRSPGELLAVRPVAQAQQGVEQRRLRSVDPGGNRIPPVVDHRAERIERL